MRPAQPPTPVSPYEALSEEKKAVIAYARKHPELRHRELAWRMVDEDVAFLSPSTVYRVLKEANLVCPWRRRGKRTKAQEEKATRPDQRWSTDLMHVQVGVKVYYFVAFLDDYSRYIVHHELLLGMDGLTVSLAAQKAIESLAQGAGRQAGGDAGDPLGQRQLLRLEGVPRGAPGERPGASSHPTALPGGEWADGAGQPDAPRGPGGGGPERSPDGRSSDRAGGASLQ